MVFCWRQYQYSAKFLYFPDLSAEQNAPQQAGYKRVSLPSSVTSYSRQEFELCWTQFCSTKRALEWKNPQEKEIRGKRKRKWREGIGSLSSSSSFSSSRSSSSFFLSSKVHGWEKEKKEIPSYYHTATFLPYSFLSFPYLPSRLLFLLPFSLPSGFTWGRGNREEGKRGRECF